METDDDMIMVIVGDGENEECSQPEKEMLDGDEIEKIIETAETHGEMVEVFIKEEIKEEFVDYEDNDSNWEVDGDVEYVPDEEDYEDDDYHEIDEGSANKHRMRRPIQQKSFVKELQDQYPELVKDSEGLVNTMSEIMRNVKPPPPPRDYFIMNGIMFECVYCGIMSETQPAAGRHYQEKHGERYLICFACGVDFRSTTNLYKHEKRCNSPDAVVVLKARAAVLGRKGRSRPYIPKHFPDDDHSKKPGARRFACGQCPAAFVSKTYLRSHELLHRGLRPYRCAGCPCAYTSLAALSRHSKKHSDEQYMCDHCGRAFKVKAALATHMDTHLPMKRFGCERCEKRYATKAALLRHVHRQHLQLPPPCVCKICHKRYPLMSVLKEHTKKAHGLLLMTRRMFFKSLPMLTETKLQQAKVVLKSELEPDPMSYQLWESPLSMSKSPVEVDGSADQLPNRSQDSSPVEMVCKLEPLAESGSPSEQRIVLTEEVLEYLQSVQGRLANGENCNLVLIEDGELLN